MEAIANLKRWRDIGDGPIGYTAGNKQFADDVKTLLREYERLERLLREVAGTTFDGPIRATINAALRQS